LDHLDGLKFVNWAMALFMLLTAALLGAWASFTLFMTYDSVEPLELVISVLPQVVGVLLSIVLASSHWQVGYRIQWGHGRFLQTFLALVHLCNCPIGWAYAGYALWVCWIQSPQEFE